MMIICFTRRHGGHGEENLMRPYSNKVAWLILHFSVPLCLRVKNIFACGHAALGKSVSSVDNNENNL